ncbi:hypothetical protein [Helicobacter cinaedi]|nr:hypothetical protein [Helicobacter cinaedi]
MLVLFSEIIAESMIWIQMDKKDDFMIEYKIIIYKRLKKDRNAIR